MRTVKEILEELKPGVDFEGLTDIATNRVLDSIAIVTLVSELCDEYDIEITVPDIIPENFDSIEAMEALVEKLQDED